MSHTGTQRISIVIPTRARPRELAACLHALQPQMPAGGCVEVLVLDDGADSATRNLVEKDFPFAQWHAGPRRGPASNRNHGARLARGEWLLFLDDDCIPRPTYLSAYQTCFQDGDAKTAFEGATIAPGEQPSLLWEAPHNPTGGLLISCNFAISRSFFFDVGGFDERYPLAAFEDTEFADRFVRHRGKIHFVPDAAVDHPWRPLPPARILARRWEARVISTLDLGASSWELAWRLPEHIFKVISSRFRGQSLRVDSLRAAVRFAGEFIWMLRLLRGWISRHSSGPRSQFWKSQVAQGRSPARFGL